jgi:hypothetical protein
MTGDEKAFKSTSTKVDQLPLVRREICSALLKMQEQGSTFTPEIQSLMDERMCRGAAESQ